MLLDVLRSSVLNIISGGRRETTVAVAAADGDAGDRMLFFFLL
jgi:hypothetical protein